MACSRDPECLEGHEGMAFQSGVWRHLEKRRASNRRYSVSEKGRVSHRRSEAKRYDLGTTWGQANPDLRREVQGDYRAFHRLQGTM